MVSDSRPGFSGVAARIVRRLGIPCVGFCAAYTLLCIIRAAVHVVTGGGWPEFRLWLDVMLIGALCGLIAGCAAKDFKTEGRMRADPFGVSGLILGLLGVFTFYFFAPVSIVEKLESFHFIGEENGAFVLVFMCGSAIVGIVGMVFGEIVKAMSAPQREALDPRSDRDH